MDTPATDTPIFVVGCPRSGTTLLRNLLRSHPRLTFPPESHFIPDLFRAYGDPKSDYEACSLASKILRLWWVRSWRLSLAPSDFASCRSFGQVLSLLYGAWAAMEGKPRWGDKTPHYVTQIPLLVRIFPRAKVIHVYRDGRDVALSWLESRFEPRNVFTAAKMWRDRVTAGAQAGADLSADQYMEVRYETLLQRPRETMQTVCDFVQETFHEAVLRPTSLDLGAYGGIAGRLKSSHIPAQEIVSGNLTKWKTQMPRRDREIVESVAGGLLVSLGYEMEGHRLRVSRIQATMWHLHHSFLWWANRLGTSRPGDRFTTFLLMQRAKLRARWRQWISRS